MREPWNEARRVRYHIKYALLDEGVRPRLDLAVRRHVAQQLRVQPLPGCLFVLLAVAALVS